jgi:hypothetical protein
MADHVLLYISAAPDLAREREILGRAITEVPVTLGWRIVQSPARDEPVDLDAVARSAVHLLLLGSDIRAPIGQEWMAARRAGRWPVLFLKEGVLRTPAAQDFVRFMERQANWQRFKAGVELQTMVLKLLADHLLDRAPNYALAPNELAHLRQWRSDLEARKMQDVEQTRGGAGESAVLLSPERYVPSEGVLIKPEQKKGQP